MSVARPILLLALDVDGTLLTSDHKITRANRAAIEHATRRGVMVVLASARGPRAVAPIMAEAGISGYAITYMGALAGRLDSSRGTLDQVIAEHPIPHASARLVVTRAQALGIDVGWMVRDGWVVGKVTPVIRREENITALTPSVIDDLTALEEAPYKIQCMLPQLADEAPLLTLRANLPSECDAQFSSPYYLEVVRHGVNKLSALIELGRALHIDTSEMAAIGDGENDMAMLAGVGLGVAMGNAKAAVQQTAQWVTETNDRDGVALAIYRMATAARI